MVCLNVISLILESWTKYTPRVVGGATVDSALVKPYLPTVLSLKDQIRTEYLPKYSSHPSFFDWKAENTLFASFLGINDVGNAYANANASWVLADDIAEYASLMDEVYQSGARNFLFLNTPPVNRAPLTTALGADAEALEASYIAAYNLNITLMAAILSTTYGDVRTFVFDTNNIFNQVCLGTTSTLSLSHKLILVGT